MKKIKWPKKNKTKKVLFEFEDSFIEEIDSIRKSLGLTRKKFVKIILEEFLNENKRKKNK